MFNDYKIRWSDGREDSITLSDSTPQSFAVGGIATGELPAYTLENFKAQDGDIMIDVGGHCGVVSIFYAKFFPNLKIYAYEPMPNNFETFNQNLKANNVSNVEVFNLAVTSNGRDVTLCQPISNTGGANVTDFLRSNETKYMKLAKAKSTTLDDIFKENKIEKCKLLKMDCECSEHEILHNFSFDYPIENFIGELHINGTLRRKGYSIEKIIEILDANNVKHKTGAIEVADSVEDDGRIISYDYGLMGQL
mgnify:CR=1 FL=1|tara:strand:- start:300 stop:1049 length:750 start_codon:yes stop_codon:yes gene_type:complete